MTDMILLRYGDSGPVVELLQLSLYRSGTATSCRMVFLEPDAGVAEKLQRSNGLTEDGIAGEKTWMCGNAVAHRLQDPQDKEWRHPIQVIKEICNYCEIY